MLAPEVSVTPVLPPPARAPGTRALLASQTYLPHCHFPLTRALIPSLTVDLMTSYFCPLIAGVTGSNKLQLQGALVTAFNTLGIDSWSPGQPVVAAVQKRTKERQQKWLEMHSAEIEDAAKDSVPPAES
jgi:hypothetical protein